MTAQMLISLHPKNIDRYEFQSYHNNVFDKWKLTTFITVGVAAKRISFPSEGNQK